MITLVAEHFPVWTCDHCGKRAYQEDVQAAHRRQVPYIPEACDTELERLLKGRAVQLAQYVVPKPGVAIEPVGGSNE